MGLLYKQSGVKGTSKKWELPVFIQWNLKVQLYTLVEKTGVLGLLDHVSPVSLCSGGVLVWQEVAGDGHEGDLIPLPPMPNLSKKQHFKLSETY